VRALTVFAFSTDNWRRPEDEARPHAPSFASCHPARATQRFFSFCQVAGLFAVMQRALAEELPALRAAGVRLVIAGDTAPLPAPLRAALAAAAAATAGGRTLRLTVALNYSGRADIVAAARALATSAAAGGLAPSAIDEAAFAAALATSAPRGEAGEAPPDPDVIIRTSGEQRLSNFLLWQAAFAELVFCDTLWPDFGEEHLAEALRQYAGRQRRFGGHAEPE